MSGLSDAVEWVVKRISALTRTATDADVTDSEYMAVDNASAYTRKITMASLATWILGKIKSLTTTITAFRTGDVIPVDGPSGTAKMAKDDLLREAAQRALAHGVASAFDPTRDEDHKYLVGDIVTYRGVTYTFRRDHFGDWPTSGVTPTNEETRSKLPRVRGTTDSIRLSKLEDFIYDVPSSKQYENIVFEQGGFQDGVLVESPARIRSTLLIPVSKGDYVDFSMEETGYRIALSVLDENLKLMEYRQSAFYVRDESAAYLYTSMFKADDTLPITPNEGSLAGLTISIPRFADSSIHSSIENLKNALPNLHSTQPPITFALEQGRYFYGIRQSSNEFVRLSSPILAAGGEKLLYSIASGWLMYVHYLDSYHQFIGNESDRSGTGEVTCPPSSKYACVFIYNGGNEITPSDAETYADFSISPVRKSFDNIPGSTLFNVAQIFDKCICIGDSLTAGYSTYHGVTIGSQTAVKLPFNWPSYMAKRTGCSYKNLGIGSSNTHHWRYSDGPSEDNRTDITLANEFANAYFIGLGANDRRWNRAVGSSSGIKTNKDENSDTFYGNYDWIVRTLHEYNPNAIIFVMTMATLEGDGAAAYNTAIRQIAVLYDYVILIDLWADTRYKSAEIAQRYDGHFNPLGYNLAADLIYDNLCRAIIENESKFRLLPLFSGYPVPD